MRVEGLGTKQFFSNLRLRKEELSDLEVASTEVGLGSRTSL